jgi:hypothetical protein
MSMGEETARSLGMNTGRTRIISSVLVVVITGAAVAAAGPIGFIGLATSHIVRSIVGPDYRWVLPYSLVVGAFFLTTSDILGRIIARPGEIQVGIVTAVPPSRHTTRWLVILAARQSLSQDSSRRTSPDRSAAASTSFELNSFAHACCDLIGLRFNGFPHGCEVWTED